MYSFANSCDVVPMVPCVYVLRHKDGYRYIGMTVNARNRFMYWSNRFRHSADWDFAILAQSDDDAERRRLEVAAIRHAAAKLPRGMLLNHDGNSNSKNGHTAWTPLLREPDLVTEKPDDYLFPCWGNKIT
jgi:hypothetical protein